MYRREGPTWAHLMSMCVRSRERAVFHSSFCDAARLSLHILSQARPPPNITLNTENKGRPDVTAAPAGKCSPLICEERHEVLQSLSPCQGSERALLPEKARDERGLLVGPPRLSASRVSIFLSASANARSLQQGERWSFQGESRATGKPALQRAPATGIFASLADVTCLSLPFPPPDQELRNL